MKAEEGKRRAKSGLANCLAQIEWSSHLEEAGGITWVELYIWYRMHSPPVKADLLATAKPLLSEITISKKDVREVSTCCINEEQAWNFAALARTEELAPHGNGQTQEIPALRPGFSPVRVVAGARSSYPSAADSVILGTALPHFHLLS